MITRRAAIAGMAGAALVGALPALAQPAKPNILLVMVDDLGWETIHANGSLDYDTPNLDRVAAEGRNFTQCFTTPVCTTTRVMLMSGQYPPHNGWMKGIFVPGMPDIVDPALLRMAPLMRNAGYRVGLAGKWQLARLDNHPNHVHDSGFDEYLLWTWELAGVQQPRYWNPTLTDQTSAIWSAGHKVYGPDLFTRWLQDFMCSCEASGEPFFAYYPMAMVHKPFEDTPFTSVDGMTNSKPQFKAQMVYLDKLVGDLMRTVEASGRETIVVFTGDNGTHKDIKTNFQTASGPIKVQGGKGGIHDYGIRVPLIAWGSGIAQGVDNMLVDHTDLLPTLAEIAGTTLTDADGASLWPRMQGGTTPTRDFIYTQYDTDAAVRTDEWKLYADGGERRIVETAEVDEAIPVALRNDMQAALDSLMAGQPTPLFF